MGKQSEPSEYRIAQRMLESEIEIGRIHADEHRRRFRQQLALQFLADAEDLWNMPQCFDIAAHRQLLHRPVGVEPRGDHARAADPIILGTGGQTAREAVEQRRRQQVAGRLACHHRDAQGTGFKAIG